MSRASPYLIVTFVVLAILGCLLVLVTAGSKSGTVAGQGLTGLEWFMALDSEALQSECGEMRGSVPWRVEDCVLSRRSPTVVRAVVDQTLHRDRTLMAETAWMVAGTCEGRLLHRNQKPFLITICPVPMRPDWAKISIASS